ncbi:MAG: ATP synthase F1 subunit delta [Salibacteraceae bacterium]
MKGSKSASRYAQSLLDLAIEREMLEEVKADVEVVTKACAESRDLELMFQSPIIKTDQKLGAISAVFKNALNPLTLDFLMLITNKGRERFIPVIMTSFMKLYKEKKGIVTAEVTSAVPLSDDQKKAISESIKNLGKTVDLVEHVDASIIGGLKVRVEDTRFDASLRKKLNELKYDLSK